MKIAELKGSGDFKKPLSQQAIDRRDKDVGRVVQITDVLESSVAGVPRYLMPPHLDGRST